MTDATANALALARRANNCTTHHHACDCREHAHAQEVDRLRAQNAELENVIARRGELLSDIRDWDVDELMKKDSLKFYLPLAIRKRIAAELETPPTGEQEG